MIKYSNYIILLILLSTSFFFKDSIQISTNLLSLFASKEAVTKLDIASKLGYSKDMLIIVKGFDRSSKTKVKEITKKLEKINHISLVQSSIVPSIEIQNYYKKYYPILATFNDELLSKEDIKKKIQNLYDAQFTNIFYSSIDKDDPLKLFTLKNNSNIEVSHKGEFITLGNYGYLIRVNTDISASEMGKAKILYNDIHSLLDNYTDVLSFAPFYYTVENSQQIQKDVQWIILLSTIVLLSIYYLFLKNIKLLSHTLIALFSSMIFAGLISTSIFSNFSILSLAFGMSITAVSIDYLLHYYFHGFYQGDKRIDKNVLYGYLTTIVAFGIFSFIPIPIISQISFFAVISLSFSYLLFTFIFPNLSIDQYVEIQSKDVAKKRVPAYLIFIISIILFGYSAINFTLDKNIRNLDYQNEKLLNIQKMIMDASKTNLIPIIVEANSKKELIDNLHILHKKEPSSFSLASFIPQKDECLKTKERLERYNFNELNTLITQEATKIGFRDGYFNSAYDFTKNLANCEIDDFKIFKMYNLSVYNDYDGYHTIALVKDIAVIDKLSFTSSINIKEIFSNMAMKMYKDLSLYASIVITAIFLLLFLSVKRKLLYALNYIFFPISVTLALIVSVTELNLMHLFSLIILIAIGIDYGIYMSNTDKPSNTTLAIKYSILSTFAAFGVLVFSSIVALNSIGLVISIGTVAIFFLIKVMK